MGWHLIGSSDPIARTLCRVRTSRTLTARLAAATVAVVFGALLTTAPAGAETPDDAFLDALGTAGLGVADPADAVALGQSVCPMLSEPGQSAADAAATVADAAGMSLGPATMFTGLAITIFCPGAVSALGNGELPLPLDLFGF